MRYGGYILYLGYLEVYYLQSPYGRLSALAGAFNIDFDFAHSHVLGDPGGVFGYHLGGIGSCLTAALEPEFTRRTTS